MGMIKVVVNQQDQGKLNNRNLVIFRMPMKLIKKRLLTLRTLTLGDMLFIMSKQLRFQLIKTKSRK